MPHATEFGLTFAGSILFLFQGGKSVFASWAQSSGNDGQIQLLIEKITLLSLVW